MNAHPILAIALLAASPAVAQVEALAPDNGPVSFQGFADAAVACAQAVQARTTETGPIEQRGWYAYAQAPDIATQATTFSRPVAHVLVVVLKEPPQCSANWDVSSATGQDAVFSGADEAVAAALQQAFGRRPAAADVQSARGRKLHRYTVGDAVVLVSMEAQGVAGALLKVGAMNKNNLASAERSPAGER